MWRKLAVVAVVAIVLLWSHDRARAQTFGRTIGPSGGFGAGPVVPLGGIGGAPTPLRLSTDSTAPNLRGTLPVVPTPDLELPQNAEPAIAVNGPTDPRGEDTPALSRSAATSSEHAVRQDLAEVNQAEATFQQPTVVVGGGEPDDPDEDDDPDEGDMPWWVWLLLVAGVVMAVNWVRR